MNISITFRHMDSSEAVTKYASGKLAKLQRFLRSPLMGKLTFTIDRKKHVVEARISSGVEHLEARETSDDMYASIDSVMDKLDRQIRGHKGVARAKRRDGKSIKTTPVRVAPAAASAKQAAPAKKAAPTKARPKSKR
jgi:putative sigma-54 modulation protein